MPQPRETGGLPESRPETTLSLGLPEISPGTLLLPPRRPHVAVFVLAGNDGRLASPVSLLSLGTVVTDAGPLPGSGC